MNPSGWVEVWSRQASWVDIVGEGERLEVVIINMNNCDIVDKELTFLFSS